jgi:hypothetical protein
MLRPSLALSDLKKAGRIWSAFLICVLIRPAGRNVVLKSVHIAIEAAEKILPGEVAPEGEEDPRWQAIMLIEDFVETEPEAILPFVLRWGRHEQEDLRTAIAVLLVEHLLEFHFQSLFHHIEKASLEDALFGDMFLRAWKLGQAKEPENSARFEALRSRIKLRK